MTPPDAQSRVALEPAKGLKKLVYSFCRCVGANEAECKGLGSFPAAAAQSSQIKPVVQVLELRGGQAEIVLESIQKVARRRNKTIYVLDDVAHVPHAPCDPVLPIVDVPFGLLRRTGKVTRVATLGTLLVVLPIADRPYLPIIRWMHLHELPTGAHQPIIVQRENDWQATSGRFENKRG